MSRHISGEPISDREDLIHALMQAAELEHAICCLYLFASYSLKRRPEEGVSEAQLAKIRDWMGTLNLIARQEMEHLAIVANLLTAVGGMPHFFRPDFPVEAGRYGSLPELSLEPFSVCLVKKLIRFEEPQAVWLRSEILRELKPDSSDYPGALGIVLDAFRGEFDWPGGEVWTFSEDASELEVVEYVTRHLIGGRRTEIQRDPDLHLQLMHRHSEALPPWTGKLELQSGANTQSEVKYYHGCEPRAVFRFFYETFRERDEDRNCLEVVDAVLNGPPPNPVADRLEEIRKRWLAETPPARPAGAVEDEDSKSSRPLSYSSLGGFYNLIRKAFLRLSFRNHAPIPNAQLLIGPPQAQMDYRGIGFPARSAHNIALLTVNNLDQALAAIEDIVEEGEGGPGATESNHYGRLRHLCKSLEAELSLDPGFRPARNVAVNPVASPATRDGEATGQSLIRNQNTLQVTMLFNKIYHLFLLMSARYFAHPEERPLGSIIFQPLMTMVIRPLGEILTELPADNCDLRAGPTFEQGRIYGFPPHRLSAWKQFRERLGGLGSECQELAERQEDSRVAARLSRIASTLRIFARKLEGELSAATMSDGGT